MNITPVKSGRNYRFRLGLQMFRMKTNESYSLIVELYNRDYETWQRQQTYVNGTGIWVISNNTTKYQHLYGSSGDIYYTKTLIKFKKTSSSAPIFVYFTVHFDDNGGDLNTYPKDFKNQVYIVAYGIGELTDHVDPEVYDAHEAFGFTTIKDRRTNGNFSISSPLFLHSINFHIFTNKNTNDLKLDIVSNGNSINYVTHLNELNSKNYQNNNFKSDMAFVIINKPIPFYAETGIRTIGIYNLNGEMNNNSIDILFSYL